MEITEKESEMFAIMEEMIASGVRKGIKQGIEQAKHEERLKEKITYDIKYKNTKLLLINYRKFQKFCNNATISEKELDTATVEELMDKLYCETYDEVTIVQSIMVSKKRTEIIMKHIDRVVNIYIYDSETSGNDEKRRRAHILKDVYISGKGQQRMSDIAQKYHISERQVNRDKNRAIEEVAVLMFGIDGIRKM